MVGGECGERQAEQGQDCRGRGGWYHAERGGGRAEVAGEPSELMSTTSVARWAEGRRGHRRPDRYQHQHQPHPEETLRQRSRRSISISNTISICLQPMYCRSRRCYFLSLRTPLSQSLFSLFRPWRTRCRIRGVVLRILPVGSARCGCVLLRRLRCADDRVHMVLLSHHFKGDGGWVGPSAQALKKGPLVG
jgi:hypothetical protein